VFPHVGAGFWPLIGLAGVLGGVMRSPFTGVVFAIELTGRFDAALPLIIGTTVAYGVSVLILPRSVLTEKIARRGYHLSREYDVDPLEALFVDEVLADETLQLRQDLTVKEALEQLLAHPSGSTQRLFPVTDLQGRLTAVISENTLIAAAANGAGDTIVRTYAHPEPVCTHGNDTLRQAALCMASSGLTRLIVTDRLDPTRVTGIVSLQQLLEGRVRDLQEATHPERVLMLRPRREPKPPEMACEG
jgi:CIC family chloride channel protein